MKNIVEGLIVVLFFSALCISANLAAASSTPEMRECIQKYLPKAQTDVAVRTVAGACIDLFTWQVPLSDMFSTLPQKDQAKLREEEQEKRKAKKAKDECILSLDNFYAAKTDLAARTIYAYSECNIEVQK